MEKRFDQYGSLSELTACVNAGNSREKSLNEANVREALSQISGDTIWRTMLKGVEKGQAYYKEAGVMEHLLALVSEYAEESVQHLLCGWII